MQCEKKLNSDGGDSGSSKSKGSYAGAYDGVWLSLCSARVRSLETGSRFCVGSSGRNLVSIAMRCFNISLTL
jgi:hypothetical protein